MFNKCPIQLMYTVISYIVLNTLGLTTTWFNFRSFIKVQRTRSCFSIYTFIVQLRTAHNPFIPPVMLYIVLS